MYPHERSLVRTLADKPFAIIGVNSDKFHNVTKKVCEPKNISWPSFTNVQEGEKKISDDWKVRYWPTTYLIDKDGVIRYTGLRGSELDAAIEELMAEMDVEVNLKDVDHEAEDEIAMEAYLEEFRAARKAAKEAEKAEEKATDEPEATEEPKATSAEETSDGTDDLHNDKEDTTSD